MGSSRTSVPSNPFDVHIPKPANMTHHLLVIYESAHLARCCNDLSPDKSLWIAKEFLLKVMQHSSLNS